MAFFNSDKNEIDLLGRTPLMMAIMLRREDWITILWNHLTDPKHRSFPFFKTPLEYAAEFCSFEMVRNLLTTDSQIKQNYLETHKEKLFQMLEEIPDFQLNMKFEWRSSIIPFISSIAPSDTFRIYK